LENDNAISSQTPFRPPVIHHLLATLSAESCYSKNGFLLCVVFIPIICKETHFASAYS
jgi:hypothetical protein